ncbi:hypothetical protein [Nocardia alba]|uniref:Uncharacterized protein n=1 Tax=Nocardia alba TaxID=225051 RepID=A0A4V2P9J9_9NOCA|nr:hypothetical protein [Nocardia alba]TCJ89965.1 hypothetical protein DFR71_6256 [Nocardia alba]
MSRTPRGHRDPVGERVAQSYLTHDLALVRQVLPRHDQDLLDYILINTGVDPDHNAALIRKLTGRIRADPVLRGLLLTYLGDRVPAGTLCLWCGRELRQRKPGAPGRPAKYCGDNHRQSGSRARRRQARRRAHQDVPAEPTN